MEGQLKGLEKTVRRVGKSFRLLRSARWSERPALARYLVLNLLERVTGHVGRPYLLTLQAEGLQVTYETFSSQLGPYIDIFVERVYEQVPSFRAEPGQTVLDIGANIGFYTLRQAMAVGPTGRVYAFEPNPSAFDLLTSNVQDNALEWVTCVPKAVSNNREDARLWLSRRWTSTASLFHDTRRTGESGIFVASLTLDEFVEKQKIDRIHLLKMDTEGAEAIIVEGGLRLALPMTDRVVMESHRTRARVTELLAPLGFEIVLDDGRNHIVYFERRPQQRPETPGSRGER
jgi:FkbM family methyltransferase